MVLLLLLQNSDSKKGVKISRIQVYLWGMSGKKNRQILARYRAYNSVGELPITPDGQLRVLIANAEQVGLIAAEREGESYLRYKLTLQGQVLLNQLKNTTLYNDIEEGLKEIGYLPDTKIDYINYVWAYDIL